MVSRILEPFPPGMDQYTAEQPSSGNSHGWSTWRASQTSSTDREEKAAEQWKQPAAVQSHRHLLFSRGPTNGAAPGRALNMVNRSRNQEPTVAGSLAAVSTGAAPDFEEPEEMGGSEIVVPIRGSRIMSAHTAPAVAICLGDRKHVVHFSKACPHMQANDDIRYYFALYMDNVNEIATDEALLSPGSISAPISVHETFFPSPLWAEEFYQELDKHFNFRRKKKAIAHFESTIHMNREGSRTDYAILDLAAQSNLYSTCITVVTTASNAVRAPGFHLWSKFAFHASVHEFMWGPYCNEYD